MSNIVSNLPKVSPASDIIERDNAFYIYLDMPGVCKEQLDIEVEGNELYIQAQTCHCIAPEERLHSLEFGDVHYKAVYTLSDQMDADKIEFPLSVRKWKDGDKFRPLGMFGNKKVSDYLTDVKRDMFTKENRYVLISAKGQILCLLGERIDDRFKISSSTARILEAHLLK